MKKTFAIRIDLESQKGIKEGLPKLLKLFREENVKASFYLVMGGESNIFEVLKNSGELKTAGERRIKLWSLKEKLRMVLFPIDFTKKNKNLIKKILTEDHELGLHGWKHREWTRNLKKINLTKRLHQMISRYKRFFGVYPKSWTSPGFNINEKVLFELEKRGITHVSDFGEKKTFGKIKNIPMNILGENKMPFIEYWVGKGKTDEEIFEIFKKEIENKNFVSFYLHGMFEGRFKIGLLKKMVGELKKQNFESKRIIDIK